MDGVKTILSGMEFHPFTAIQLSTHPMFNQMTSPTNRDSGIFWLLAATHPSIHPSIMEPPELVWKRYLEPDIVFGMKSSTGR